MNKNKVFIIRLSKMLGLCAITLTLCTGCVSYGNKFDDDDIFSDSKKEVSSFSYEISQERLVINSDYSELNIVKGNNKDVEVTLEKKAEGDNEQEINDKLKNITCSYDNGTLNIMCNESKEVFNSSYVKADIKVPETIKVLETNNDVGDIAIDGDYDSLKSSVDVGRLCFDGEAKDCNVKTDTGDLELHFNKVKPNYRCKASCDIGAINIKIPTGSNINVTGSKKDKVQVEDEVNISGDGVILDAKVNVGSIKVGNN